MRKLIWNLSSVAQRAKAERGMSLVEATIILMTLAILTAVAAPSINDYVQDARDVKAKEDVEALGTSIARMVRDTGLPCLAKVAATGCTVANRVDLLESDGTDATSVTGAISALTAGSAQNEAINWAGSGNEPAASNIDTVSNQLVLNAANYNDPSENSTITSPGPRAGLGWRGAYLSGVSADPWGHKYQANTIFLGVATNAAAGTSEGLLSSGWIKDVIVVSPGRNGVIETPFAGSTNGGSGASSSDDQFYVVSGSTR